MTQQNNLPTIGLSMIVRNEEKVIVRCLNSIWGVIDNFTIVDTGSTDNTKKIIKDFFDSKGIFGEIHDHPFVNFEDARNFALNKLRESGKADYGMIIDADEQIKLSDLFDVKKFKQELSLYDASSVIVIQKENRFGRRCFYKTSEPFKWKGKVHNVLVCDKTKLSELFIQDDSITIKVNTDGHTWTKESQREKYLAHAKILEKEVSENNSPRDVFYLAQSYRDASEPEKAIEWYTKRLGMKNGFYEERYYSQLMIAGLKWKLKYPIWEIADEYMRCGEIDTLRAEHLYHLKCMYEKNNRPQCAIKIGELLLKYKNPYPQRILLLNPEAYNYKTSPQSKETKKDC